MAQATEEQDVKDKVIFSQLVREGNVEKVREWLQCGRPSSGQCAGQVMESPLHIAVVEDNAEMVDLLLDGTDHLMATNMYGETPLHLACRYGKTDLVKKLLEHGAEIDYKDCGECTPLFHAVNSNHPDVVRLLVSAGCDLDTLNEELITPLDQAILHNRSEIISLLLKGGCAIDKSLSPYPDHYANSILFALWGNSDLDNIEVLIDCGYAAKYSLLRTLLEVLRKLTDDEGSLQALARITEQPQTLANLCRICIRRRFQGRRQETGGAMDALINELTLPQKLKNYLTLSDCS